MNETNKKSVDNLESLQNELEDLIRWQPSIDNITENNLKGLEEGRQDIQSNLLEILDSHPFEHADEETTRGEAELRIGRILSSVVKDSMVSGDIKNLQEVWNMLMPLYENLETAVIMLKLLNAAENGEPPHTLESTKVYRGKVAETIEKSLSVPQQ